jgi:hypothetical protein
MNVASTLKRLSALCAAVVVLQACNNKSGSNNNPPGGGSNDTSGTSGIAVDPYIVGAVFQELKPDRTVVQESSPSGTDGVFKFAKALAKGNLVVMTAKGTHNGVAYAVQLKRKVDGTAGALVASPITTLFAEDKLTAGEVAALLTNAVGSSFTIDDLMADPMARLAGSDGKTADSKLVAAAVATSAALQVLRGDVQHGDLMQIVSAVAPKLVLALKKSGTPQAVASAASAIGEYVARQSVSLDDVKSCTSRVDDAVITSLVVAATAGQHVGIEDQGGHPQVVVNSGTIADQLDKSAKALDEALDSRSTAKFLAVVNGFSAAANLVDVDTTASASDKDKARFFGAVARVALLAQPYSDNVDNGLNDVGDVLDAYGLGGTSEQRSNLDTIKLPSCVTGVRFSYNNPCQLPKLPAGSPNTAKLRAFVANQVASGLAGAVALLEGVTKDFAGQLYHGKKVVNFDYTDALFVKAVAQGMLAAIELQQAYDLDVDPAGLQAKIQSRTASMPYGAQQFFEEYPQFLKLRDAATLPSSRTHALAAVATLKLAVQSLRSEKHDQKDDFVKIPTDSCGISPATGYYSCTTTYNGAAKLDQFDRGLTEVETALNSTVPYTITMNTPVTTDDVTIDVTKFFAGVDLRATLPAKYTAGAGGDRPGPFQDATFGGVLVKSPIDFNADLDADGSPDIFGGYTYFFDDYLTGRPFWGSGYANGFSWNGTFSFERTSLAHGTFTYSGSAYEYPAGTRPIQWSGSYAFVRNVLTLSNFAGAAPFAAATSASITAPGYEHYFSADVIYMDAQGNRIGTEYIYSY